MVGGVGWRKSRGVEVECEGQSGGEDGEARGSWRDIGMVEGRSWWGAL